MKSADQGFDNEVEYRNAVQSALKRIEVAFENVDPDIVECSIQFGALTLQFGDRSKCILSNQPSVQQIWLAYAAKGVAHHFDWNKKSSQWLDDKNPSLEFFKYLLEIVVQKTGLKGLKI